MEETANQDEKKRGKINSALAKYHITTEPATHNNTEPRIAQQKFGGIVSAMDGPKEWAKAEELVLHHYCHRRQRRLLPREMAQQSS